MLEIDTPGRGTLDLEHLLLDVNGTIAAGGVLVPGVAEALASLESVLHAVAVTADTHGTAPALRAATGIDIIVIAPGNEAAQKQALLRELGAERTVAVGNGANDALMLREAAVGIAVIGTEGAARAALDAADIVVTDIADALALLLEPRRLLATLRT
ncbi:MAG: HAD family hydrolase [Coriobacteriia bacterium]|nr:HAD family hydrolase [Coriobacteriia bacterium]MBN2847772.1 HAD family hydrolase [Coriobacteriia bacterium]